MLQPWRQTQRPLRRSEGEVSVEATQHTPGPVLAAPSVTRPGDHTLMSPCMWVPSLRNTRTQR